MAAIMSFRAEKCCRLVRAHEASASYNATCSSVWQLLIHSTFVLVLEIKTWTLATNSVYFGLCHLVGGGNHTELYSVWYVLVFHENFCH